jgi:Response regulator containing CheY-like receiver domain and AraC-type DNA-binding domain
MLEGYGLLVDSAESAEQSLEYLKHTRPDVIFMDHLMPGMDGFQAVQAIKANPATATIPVVMYTSQEGELYLSQARALGAVGVLPKTVKQADVSKVLYQLRLLPDRRESRAATVEAAEDATVEIDTPRQPTVGELESAIRAAVAPLLQEHNSELRRFLLASLESFARRAANEAKPETPAEPQPAPEPQVAPVVKRSSPFAIAIAVLALIATGVLAVLYARQLDANRALEQVNARLSSVIEEQQAQIEALQSSAKDAASAADAAALAPTNGIRPELVAYGEVPLSGTRLERLRALITDLRAQEFKGKIRVVSYSGEFCLSGNGFEGYSLAAAELPYKQCDVVGNPFDESMSPAQRQSVAFANLLSSLRSAGGSLTVEVQHAGRQAAVPYPDPNQEGLTAGEWNKIAALNNRVEFITEPNDDAS